MDYIKKLKNQNFDLSDQSKQILTAATTKFQSILSKFPNSTSKTTN